MDHSEMVLAFSILVGRVCEESCKPETMTKWNTFFMKKFKGLYSSFNYNNILDYVFFFFFWIVVTTVVFKEGCRYVLDTEPSVCESQSNLNTF